MTMDPGGPGADKPDARPGSGRRGATPGGAQPVAPATAPADRNEATWLALAGALVGLIIVAVFILQNLKSVRVSFFWTHWRIPLGVDLLLATVLGGLVVFAAGSIRILRLRRLARRQAGAIERQSAR